LSEDAIDDAVKAAFKNQAEAYRKLAVKRAKDLGIPPLLVPPTEI
jgi:hypothetical protein